MPSLQETLAGRYELLDVLGRGGMGVVYRARDRVLDRTVAVKVLPADRLDDPSLVTRFEREARAAASLSHPNIVAVFDYGVDEDTRFIVMEYVPGRSLAQLLRQEGLPGAARAARIAAGIASALAAAHEKGVIHRDIKPGNVMVDGVGAVKVLDFGIARVIASPSLTRTSMVLGSASYLAPEVARGEPADGRSDIYSLGCVLYEMLTGRPPFTGDLPAAVMHQHSTRRPRPPRQLAPGVPAALDALVLRMLAKRRRDRFPQAKTLPAALAAAVNAAAVNAAAVQAAAVAPAAVDPAAVDAAAVEAAAVEAAAVKAAAAPLEAPTAPTRPLTRPLPPPPPAHRPRTTRTLAGVALPAALVLVLFIVMLTLGSHAHRTAGHATHHPAAQATATRKRATTTRAATTTPRPPATTGAATTAAAAPARDATPTTVPVAAAALTRLATQDLQSGAIDQQAGQQILQDVQDILGSYSIGHAPDVVHKFAHLSDQIGHLAGHGDIGPAALPGINAAVSALGAAIAKTTPIATNPAPGPAAPGQDNQPPGPGAPEPGKHTDHLKAPHGHD